MRTPNTAFTVLIAAVALIAFSAVFQDTIITNAKPLSATGAAVTIPHNAESRVPGAFYLDQNKAVKGYAFMITNTSLATSKSTLCQFIGETRWPAPPTYALDATNNDGLLDFFVANTLEESLPQIGDRDKNAIVDGIDMKRPDHKNEIFFGRITTPGVVSLAVIWAQNSVIKEVDIILDDEEQWGTRTVVPSVQDLENTFTQAASIVDCDLNFK